MKPTLLILAAGLGSRYGGIKQMDKVGPSGESIIDYSIYDAIRAGFGKVVFVINKSIEADFKEVFEPKLKGKIETAYVLQELSNLPAGFSVPEDRVKPWGTAHAILVAKDIIKEPFAVINADDYYGVSSYETVVDFFMQEEGNIPEYSMVGFQLDNTVTDFGTVSRGICKTDNSNYLTDVLECTNIQRVEGTIGYFDKDNKWIELEGSTIVSMNVWAFRPVVFAQIEEGFKKFLSENIQNPKAEYYIPTIITDLILTSKAKIKVLESKDKWFGVTYQQDRPFVVTSIAALVENKIYPEKLW